MSVEVLKISPADEAVVETHSPELVARFLDESGQPGVVFFEIDMTTAFDSPLFKSTHMAAPDSWRYLDENRYDLLETDTLLLEEGASLGDGELNNVEVKDGKLQLEIGMPVWNEADMKTVFDSSNADVSVDRPGNLEEGDLVLVFISGRSQTSITAPTGFNLIDYAGDLGNSLRPFMAAYYKIATGDEPAEYEFTFGVASYAKRLVAGRVTNYDTASPVDQVSTIHTGIGSASSLTIPEITTTVESLLFAHAGLRTSTSVTVDEQMDEIFEHPTDGYATSGAGKEQLFNVEATGTRTFTFGARNRCAGMMFNVSASQETKDTGYKITAPIGLTAYGTDEPDLRARWQSTIPEDTTLTVESAITDGTAPGEGDWQGVTMDQPLLGTGIDLTGMVLWIKFSFDAEEMSLTPVVEEIEVYEVTNILSSFIFTSDWLDCSGVDVSASNINWYETLDAGVTAVIETRTSPDGTDGTATAWAEATKGEEIPSPYDDFIQYRLTLSGDGANVGVVNAIGLAWYENLTWQPTYLKHHRYFWRVKGRDSELVETEWTEPRELYVSTGINRALYHFANISKLSDVWRRALYNYANVSKWIGPIEARALYNYEEVTDDPPFPSIESLNRESAYGGDSVHIYGHGFGRKPASDPNNEDRYERGYGGKVYIGNLECGIVEWNWTHIEAQLPQNANSGLITVVLTTPDPPGERISNEMPFEILVRPAEGIGLEYKIAFPDSPMLTQLILENAFSRRFIKVLSDTGAGSFRISEADDKAIGINLKDRNIVRCQYNGIDVFAWIIEGRRPAYVTDNGQRIIEVTGRGVMCLLDNAIVYPLGYPNQTSNERGWAGQTGAGILLQLITEAQARGAIPEVTVNFTATHDSQGAAWTQVETFKVHQGIGLLQVAQMLTARGAFDLEMDAEFVLHAYLNKGVNRTDEVVYEDGKGILSHSDVENGRSIRNSLLVEGEGDIVTEVQNSPSQHLNGRREAFLMARNVGDPGMLSDYGNTALQGILNAQYAKSIEVDEQPYIPFVSYKLGDTIRVKAKTHRPVDEQVSQDLRVMAITVQEDDNTPVLKFSLDLNSLMLEEQIKQKNRLDRMSSNSVDSSLASDITGSPAPADHHHTGVHALTVHDHPEYDHEDIGEVKGDILVRDEVEFKRLPVGEDGQILVADAEVPLGIKWDASSVGGEPHASTHANEGDDPISPASIGAEPSFNKNTAFNKDFGTEADTVTEGNDSRLSDAREPTAHDHDSDYLNKTNTEEFIPSGDYHPATKKYVDDSSGGGASTFTGLTDTPGDYTGEQGKFTRVNSTENGIEFVSVSPGSGADDFTELGDTPSSYTDQGGKVVAVNSGETALEFVDASGGGACAALKEARLGRIVEPLLGATLTAREAKWTRFVCLGEGVKITKVGAAIFAASANIRLRIVEVDSGSGNSEITAIVHETTYQSVSPPEFAEFTGLSVALTKDKIYAAIVEIETGSTLRMYQEQTHLGFGALLTSTNNAGGNTLRNRSVGQTLSQYSNSLPIMWISYDID